MSGTTETKILHDIKFSVLDLAPVNEGSTPADAFRNSLDLAQHAEKWGFNRYWVAEHHNMPGIASSATSVVIGYLAAGTKTIRLGSGGIMLPNHASLVIAEQFGTLESMYPGRIDLGLGRAPGSDQNTARALRRTLGTTGDEFPQQLEELRAYFSENSRFVKAVPGQGLNIPIWLLGSSGFSARLSGRLGLPFAFASHFAPNYTLPALKTYRDHFTPSEHLQTPYVMVGVNVVAADTEEEAKRLATSQQQQFLSLIRGTPTQLKPPVDDMEQVWTPYEKSIIAEKLDSTIVGTKETVKARLEQFLADTDADEMIINSQIFDHKARLRSYEIIAEIMG
ncbi:LLM class flavin-dependent oxidoreductase [Priestia filamentosa]|uniref:Luciferase n=1 Tax=Priestia filamentosa TaxID=1402861 RepID=A0A0H4KI09_9BACI|nr:LLM class flavin-dependent oxidoreductase [Priestia filamentosa]AKO93230.1 luciferase [Priestia filamentosa]MDT3763373.1 LLM class flavin-dependent oxidoreductase [Priestia filamentosa]RJS63481.1 LLM class flavin-dependent oxidoreductase [Priestia filamentosa]WRU93823.1 LLM class flavin-dependent oxidoreductase [Priestia filamentosa]